MTNPTAAERLLFCDLTRMLVTLRNAAYGDLEARIEERFRAFVRDPSNSAVGGLQITFTWTLPEGADEWAIYRTDYRTVPVTADPSSPPAAGESAVIFRFPDPLPSQVPAAASAQAQIIAFPGG